MCGSGSVLGIRIRIRILKAPEYGSNTDQDPQHWLKEGFPSLTFPLRVCPHVKKKENPSGVLHKYGCVKVGQVG